MGFKGILDSVCNEHTKVYIMEDEMQEHDLGVYDGRQIRLELVRSRLWHHVNVLLMSQGFFSSAEGNMRDIGASRHIDSGWIVKAYSMYFVYIFCIF